MPELSTSKMKQEVRAFWEDVEVFNDGVYIGDGWFRTVEKAHAFTIARKAQIAEAEEAVRCLSVGDHEMPNTIRNSILAREQERLTALRKGVK